MKDREDNLPFVSVIVPMYNAQETLKRCLDALFALDYPPHRFEVIVVDNRSTDASAAIARSYPATVCEKPDGTISSVRNFGASRATGSIYAFVDSDCVVERGWLREAVKILDDPCTGATGSGYLTPEDYTWVEKAWLYESRRPPFLTTLLPGGNLIVKRWAFLSAGGFDESLVTGEDADLCLRISKSGTRVINSPEIRCVHLGNARSLRVFFKKELWYGTSMTPGWRARLSDKTFIFVCLFMASILALLAGGVRAVAAGSLLPLCPPLLLLAAVVALPSCYRVKRSGKYRYLFHISLLYCVFFLARSLALLKSIYAAGSSRS